MNPRIPHHKAVMGARTSIVSKSEVSITALSTNHELFENHICSHSSHYEKYTNH